MKISLFSIVFNVKQILPERMFELNIQNMYDFVDEIIIVEGATKAVRHKFDGDTSTFTKNGISNDGTIELLCEIEKKYPKVKVIMGRGFWDGKTAMCNAASQIATGDYLWQLDADEFYKQENIIKIKELLEKETPDAVHFFANHFFGGFDYCIDEREMGWGNNIPWMRIFRHSPGHSFWKSHEPPEYICHNLICNKGKVLDRHFMLQLGIKIYHYSYVQESQINFKSKFYRNKQYLGYWQSFKINKATKIFNSNVYKFNGQHPKIIQDNYL